MGVNVGGVDWQGAVTGAARCEMKNTVTHVTAASQSTSLPLPWLRTKSVLLSSSASKDTALVCFVACVNPRPVGEVLLAGRPLSPEKL